MPVTPHEIEEKLGSRIGRRVEMLGGSDYFGFYLVGIIEKEGEDYLVNREGHKIKLTPYLGKAEKLKVNDLGD